MSSRDSYTNRGEDTLRRRKTEQYRTEGRRAEKGNRSEKGFPEAGRDRIPMPEGLNAQEQYLRQRRKKRAGRIIFWIIFTEVIALALGLVYILTPGDDPQLDELLHAKVSIPYETETEMKFDLGPAVPRPNVDVQLLTINDWSRPGIPVDRIRKIVVHYLGNPKTTAQENHDYFESLKDLQDTYMSANYVVGLNGEIIQCVPDGEVAWASNKANYYSISIENCHEDTTGRFNNTTYWSDVHLVAYLTEKYGLGRDDIIRHYDVTGKDCPKWYVEHPDDWEKFKDDVMTYRQECEDTRQEKIRELQAQTEKDVLKEYLNSLETETEIEPETSNTALWDSLKKKAEAFQTQQP